MGKWLRRYRKWLKGVLRQGRRAVRKHWAWFLALACVVIGVLLGVMVGVLATQQMGRQENARDEAAVTGVENTERQEIKKGRKMTETGVEEVEAAETAENNAASVPIVDASTISLADGNCTTGWGKLMLINPVFTVGTDFIGARRGQLVDLTSTYGIIEGNPANGRPLMDAEAGAALNEMLAAYRAETGRTMETRSCFRAQGTNCGRLCYATGTSDHHTGYTCDLVDPGYGDSLDTDLLAQHPEWQWLKANSYRFGFIDRFPEEWAGGSMSEPINITEQGSTGLYESWHYRYVGTEAAGEIATGMYNGGRYDSLEHYLKAKGWIRGLTSGECN